MECFDPPGGPTGSLESSRRCDDRRLASGAPGPMLGAVRALLSVSALIAGLCLIYMGYERQQSLAGKADSSLSQLGQKIDGGDHTPTHLKYYIAGTLLAVGGALGLGIVRK